MSDNKQVTVNIDGTDYQFDAGTNLVDAAESVGVEIPHYCYHPKLSVSGNCRMCLIELGMPMKDRATGEPVLDEDGKQKIGFMPKPAIACATNVSPGMHVRTKSDMVEGCRQGVMEFLLVNHPLDCPICDQAGECRLQEFSTDYGRGYSRFVEEKNVKPKRTKLGPRVTLDDERCILCSRCIRFSKEIANDDVLGFIDRGSYSTLTCYPGKDLSNNYSLNTVDICPVGALTSTDFRFRMRVWFLKPTPSISAESSVGVNTEVWSREGKIYRITPRRNDAVNDTWMSDSGRACYEEVERGDRLQHYSVDGAHRSLEEAAKEAAKLLSDGKPAYVCNGHLSLEEQFILREILGKEPGSVHQISHTGEGDGLLISSDRTPNVRGSLVTGLSAELPTDNLDKLAERIDTGEVNTIFSLRENLLKSGLGEERLKKVKVIYLGSHANEASERADVVLPGLTVFERSGSFVNQQFRLQRFESCVPGPNGIAEDYQTLGQLCSTLEGTCTKPTQLDTVWSLLAERVEVCKGLSWSALPAEGVQLDGSKWSELPFCEGPSLHYEPATAEATANSGGQGA